MEKGLEEYRRGKTVVFLIPARTDTKWFHAYVLPYASEIRFIKGRLRFGDAQNSAPFPSMIVVFNKPMGANPDPGLLITEEGR